MDTESLNHLITDVECLNEHSDFPVGNLFNADEAPLKSDVDPELLIKVHFRQPVKLACLQFTGIREETAPTSIKIFKDKPHIGFDEAEDEVATQTCESNEFESHEDRGMQLTANLKYVKFQNVTSLQIVVSANGGAETTEIKLLKIFGSTGEKSDISEWKPVKG